MERFYTDCLAFWRKTLRREQICCRAVALLPAPVMLAYGIVCLWLLVSRDPRLLRYLLVPGAVLLATGIRRFLPAPRPFAVYGLVPLRPHAPNDSFPSRHTASATVIALGTLWLGFWWGWVLVGLAVLVALSRLVAALHFPRDLLGGAALGALFAWVGFWLIPFPLV